jgi:hypothetical protein
MPFAPSATEPTLQTPPGDRVEASLKISGAGRYSGKILTERAVTGMPALALSSRQSGFGITARADATSSGFPPTPDISLWRNN